MAQSYFWNFTEHGEVLLRRTVDEGWFRVVLGKFDTLPHSTVVANMKCSAYGKAIDAVFQCVLCIVVIKAIQDTGKDHKVEGAQIEGRVEALALKMDVGYPSFFSGGASAIK